jgi:hypothetical protein
MALVDEWEDVTDEWEDVAPVAPKKTIGQMRAEAGPVQDLKAPQNAIGRTGGIGDIFASFLEHFQGADTNVSNTEGSTANLLRNGPIGSTPILDQRQTDDIRAYNESTPFWEEPTTLQAVAGGLGAGLGSLTGGARDPIGMIGGKGKTFASTFLQNAGASSAADAISQLFTRGLPTEYDPNSEVYNPQTQEFEENGPAYKAPGFDVTRVVGSGVIGGTASTALSGQLYELLKGAYTSFMKPKTSAAPGAAIPTPDAPPSVAQFYDSLPDNVKAILEANGIAPDDPRLTQTVGEFADGWVGAPNRMDERDTTIPLVDILKQKMQPKQPPLSEGQGTARMFDNARAAEAADEKPAISSAFDPRTGLPETPTGVTERPKFDLVELYKSGGDPSKAFSTEQVQTPLVTDVPGERGVRTPGETGFDPGARESVRQQKEAGLIDITPEQKQLLKKEWGIIPETVETRRKAWRALEAEQARQAEADAQGAMRVTDTSGEAIPGKGPGDPETAARTSPVSRPLERGLAEDDTGAFENLDARGTPRTQTASGNSDRPFRATDTGTPEGEGSGRVEFDLMRAAREGNPEAGFRERTKAEDFEAAARESADNARRENIEDLQRFWQQKKERRERDAGARERYEQRQERAQQQHSGKASSTTEKGFDADGRYEVDENGFVLSDKGGPIIFKDQVQAAKWIIKAQREGLDQNFELHNHPTKNGTWTAREFSRTAKSSAGGRTDSNTGDNAGAKSAGPEQGNRGQSESGAGNARASEGVSDDGAAAGPRGDAGGARDSAESQSRPAEPLRVEQRRVAETPERRAFEAAKSDLEKSKAALKATEAEAAAQREKAKADVKAGKVSAEEQRVFNDRMAAKVDALKTENAKLAKEVEKADGLTKELAAVEKSDGTMSPKYRKILDTIKRGEATRDRLMDSIAQRSKEIESLKEQAPKPAAPKAEAPKTDDATAKAKADIAAKEAKLKDLKAAADAADAKAKAAFKEEGKAKPGIPEGAKDPNAPVYESFFGFDKKPVSKDDLTEDGYPKAFGEPDLKPQAKSGNRTTKFYSNPFGDPEIWKPILKDIGTAAAKASRAFRNALRNTTSGRAFTVIEDFFRWSLYSNPGITKTMIDRYRGLGNDKVAKGLDELYSTMFTRPGEGGKTGITKQSWAEAIEPVVNQYMTPISNILEPISKRGEKAIKEFADNYEFGGKMSPEDAKIAANFKRVMDKFVADMNARLKAISDARIKLASNAEERAKLTEEAKQLQIGYIKNYIPRILDVKKLLAPGAANRFLEGASFEYQRNSGLSKKDADEAAASYYSNASGIDMSMHHGKSSKPDTMNSRVFKARRDSKLNEFYLDNPLEAMHMYFVGTIRSVALMERFGVNNEVFERKMTELSKLGLNQHDRDFVKNAFESASGGLRSTLPLGVEQAAGLMRMAQTMTFLDQATLSSIMEPVFAAARSGDILDAARGLAITARQLANMVNPSDRAEHTRMISEAFGISSNAFSDAMMANKFVGGELTTQWQRRLTSSMFNTIGLAQITRASRQAVTEIAQYSVTKWLSHLDRPSLKASARMSLDELGITQDLVPKVRKLLSENNGTPSLTSLMANTPEANAYRNAIIRFVNETIMNPTAADRPAWANSSTGGLVYGIASFSAAFTRNALFRSAKQFGGAASGFARGELTAADVYQRAIGPGIGLSLGLYAQAMIGDVRDQLYNPQQAAERTDEQQALLRLSRSGGLGNLDKFLNAAYGIKYERDSINILNGPWVSKVFRTIDNALKLQEDAGNSPNTISAEHKVTKDLYELTVAPLAVGAIALAAQGAPLPVRAGLGMWLLSPFSPGAPQTAVDITDEIVGERTKRQFRKPKDEDNEEASFKMPSLIGSANASEVPAPAKSARKRKYVISRDADGNIIAGTGNSTYLIKRDKSGRIEVEER